MARLDGDFRIRLSSIEATEVTRELIHVMADHGDRVCPHLHICLQSGSDAVLRRMRRRWSSRLFLDRCQLVREALDQPAFTTDVLIGFPGETDEDFERTCEVVRAAQFSKIHAFPFSPRRGTVAADMPDRITKQVKAERRKHLAAIERELRAEYFGSLVGSQLRVLVEGPSDDRADHVVGTSCRYAPVELQAPQRTIGALLNVVANHSVAGDRIWGQTV
jgi:threonylcarbamoyladenosine tRNA methylthiotransferase MtaB